MTWDADFASIVVPLPVPNVVGEDVVPVPELVPGIVPPAEGDGVPSFALVPKLVPPTEGVGVPSPAPLPPTTGASVPS